MIAKGRIHRCIWLHMSDRDESFQKCDTQDCAFVCTFAANLAMLMT